jgi:hypothetical protein
MTLILIRDVERRHSGVIIGSHSTRNHREGDWGYKLRDFEAPDEDKLAGVSPRYMLTMRSNPAMLLASISVSFPGQVEQTKSSER